ncbi:hypothetical protein V6Z12_A02G181100 [Gossypium hirsutum]
MPAQITSPNINKTLKAQITQIPQPKLFQKTKKTWTLLSRRSLPRQWALRPKTPAPRGLPLCHCFTKMAKERLPSSPLTLHHHLQRKRNRTEKEKKIQYL